MARPAYKRLLVVAITSSRTEDSIRSAAITLLNRYESRSGNANVYFGDVLDLKHSKIWFASGNGFAADYGGLTQAIYILKNDFNDYIGKNETQSLIAAAKQEAITNAVEQAIEEIDDPGIF